MATGALMALVVWRGVVGRRSQLFGRSVSRGTRRRHSVALTFDDGPGNGTLELISYLAGEKVLATFFVCGANVERHPEIARALHLAGHELGNHTHSHARLCPRLGWRLNLRSPATVGREIARAQQTILEATGVAPRLFRAPYGLRWFGVAGAQRRLGLLGILWTAIGHDWEWPASRVVAHLLADVSDGSILCLHDGRDIRVNPDISTTLQAVRRIVPELKRRGFRFETVSELLAADPES